MADICLALGSIGELDQRVPLTACTHSSTTSGSSSDDGKDGKQPDVKSPVDESSSAMILYTSSSSVIYISLTSLQANDEPDEIVFIIQYEGMCNIPTVGSCSLKHIQSDVSIFERVIEYKKFI